MSRSIALWLCVGFVLFLFIQDHRAKKKASFARWLVLVYVIIISSRAVSLWFNLGVEVRSPDDYLEGSPVDRNIYIGFLLLGLVLLLRRKVNWEWIWQNNKWIFIFFLFAGVSVLWSDYTLVSFKRWIKAVGLLVMVMLVLTEDDPVEALRWVFRKTALVLLPFSILLIKYYPEFGRSYSLAGGQMYTGVTGNKNMLGALCFIAGVFFVWDLLALRRGSVEGGRRTAWIDILMLLMIGYLFQKANSATSLVCFVLGVGILVFLEMPGVKKNVGHFGVYVVVSLLVFGALDVLFGLGEAIVSGLGRDMTLTGRVEIWDEVIKMAENSVVGSGYESFWLGDRAQRMWDIYSWGINQAHNGYIEMYLNLGIIGLVMLILLMLTSYKNVLLTLMSDHTMGSLRMALLLTTLLYNFAEAAFRIGLVWFIFFLSCLDYRAAPAEKVRPRLKAVKRIPTGRAPRAAADRG
jgi:O-antigen ligase